MSYGDGGGDRRDSKIIDIMLNGEENQSASDGEDDRMNGPVQDYWGGKEYLGYKRLVGGRG